jgi:hypothetical protein
MLALMLVSLQVKAVLVSGCHGVRRSLLKAGRQSGKLRVVSDSERRTSDSAAGRVSDSGRSR